ncbi:formate dehydrogenase accessory sulfurtransferase FdhD [Sphingosinicellaceae bacterium]|nr:formate dehydrogenase accessory sulfurtransferase FdhD [Sphingosinicellaceae bacterium]
MTRQPNDPTAESVPLWRSDTRVSWTATGAETADRALAVETPVALVIDATTVAVMMATPGDLDDLVTGFALTEQLIASVADIADVEIVVQPDGIEARLWLVAGRGTASAERRRAIVGPTGCGLCGIESLAQAVVVPPLVTAAGPQPTPAEILGAMTALSAAQPLSATTRASHAAALWRRGQPLLVREDVGRHNALDKLVGAAARAGIAADDAMLLLTSRVSVEMVQKAARLGVPVIVAVSAPTSLALDCARQAGITLVAVARHDGFQLFNRGDRLAALNAESPADGAMPPRVLGAVLAGGRSRRFGSDKAVSLLHGQRLIDLAVESLAPHVAAVVVCGRRIDGYDCLDDRPAADLGPLGGLAAALHHARANGFDGVLTTGCDMPAFPEATARSLIGATPAIVAGQQLAAYWPTGLADALDDYLASSENRSIRDWADSQGPRVVHAAVPIPNINTPADLANLTASTTAMHATDVAPGGA